MKFESIQLLGFKRMALTGITNFTMTPTALIQLVLGSNGSGKSSMMKELTPLPPDKEHYQNDGAKIVKIEHHGCDYILSTHFKGGAEHSFMKDGEELNPGGTVTVQRELVRQEFQITPTIHNLLTNNISFTKMSAVVRREWFTLLSDVNYEYAVKLFTKLREKQRDSIGALKLAKKQLVVEVSKTITIEAQAVLTKDINDLHEVLQGLIEKRKPIDRDSETLELIRFKTADTLKDLAKIMLAKRAIFSTMEYIETEEELTEKLAKARHEQASMELFTAKLSEAIAKFDKNIETIERAGTDGSVVLLQALQDLSDAKLRALNSLRTNVFLDNPIYANEIFDGIQTDLVPLLGQLPENADKRYNWSSKKASDEKVFLLKDKLSKASAELSRINLVIQHQERHRDDSKTECPSCHHSWSIGYNETVYNSHCTGRELLQEEIDNLTETLTIEEVFNKEVMEYSEIFQDIQRIMNSQPVLKPLWDSILREGFIFTEPARVIQTLESFRLDLGYMVEDYELGKQCEQKRAQLQLARESESFNLHEIKEQKASLELDLENSIAVLNKNNADIKLRRNQFQDIYSAKTLASNIETLYATYTETYSEAIETASREAMHRIIREVQVQLANKEAILAEARLQKGIIDSLEKNIRNLEEQDLVYKTLITELSPTDGLIAEGLLGFIRTFTAQMNAFIKKVWTYPLVIKPCGVFESGKLELDYKFPMIVNTDDNIVPDVSLGSSAMTEITDLAFRIVAMKYLHISDSPLLLDEFSSSFDVAHKAAGVGVIKALIEQQPFTQLFMISHVFEQYGAFNNMQVAVLCPNNIVTPKVYNEHVEMS